MNALVEVKQESYLPWRARCISDRRDPHEFGDSFGR